jgi:hypothetical protein
MNIPRSLPVFLTAGLLALVACDSVPLEPAGEDVLAIGTADAVPMCCKEKFERKKPHLNIVTPYQLVLFDLGDGRHAEGSFRAQMLVPEDGAFETPRLGLRNLARVVYDDFQIDITFTDATAREVDGRASVVAFAGVVQVCPERGECRTEEMTGEVRQGVDGYATWRFDFGDLELDFAARTRFLMPRGDIVAVTAGWHAMGTGMNRPVYDLTLFEGAPVAGGEFTQAGGQPANGVARWDGSGWHGLGGGIGSGPGTFIVSALAVHDGDLVAGGQFSEADGQPVRNVARWDGSAWHPMGSELASVYALAVHDGDLIAGGTLTDGDGQTLDLIARWDGSAWQPMNSGMNHSVLALAVHDGDLVAAGFFTEVWGQTVNRIARWDGASWQPMGGGMNNNVRALAVYQGAMIAGGDFTEADGQVANTIARWDGASWQPIGEGTNGMVLALAVFGGDLIAGGLFSEAGGQSASHVARWNGSAWLPMGTGMNQFVTALLPHQGNVVAGGSFWQADGKIANYVARWGVP